MMDLILIFVGLSTLIHPTLALVLSAPNFSRSPGHKLPNTRSKKCKEHFQNDLEVEAETLLLLPLDSTITPSDVGSTATGFYVHIPYCRQRCRYCDFAIVPIGSDTTNTPQRRIDGFRLMDERYRDALVQEIHSLLPSNDQSNLSSIYFGGGTPSLAPPETIQAVLDTIRDSNYFRLGRNVEITMEMDPGTFDQEKLRKLVDMGVNRISLGVQALNDAALKHIGRVHCVQDIYESMLLIHNVFSEHSKETPKFDHLNVSIDLISGLPGTSLASWADTLEKTVHILQPDHISIYDLQIEKGTVFGKWYNDDEVSTVPNLVSSAATGMKLPSPGESAYMYRYASGYLRSEGYEHYEISSYARPGKRSRHNQVYWGYNTEWFAVGLGSTSYLNQRRYTRPRAMSEYIDFVQRGSIESDGFNENGSVTSAFPDVERLTDVVMTRLRTNDGLDLNWVKCNYGSAAVTAILEGAQLAFELELANLENNTLCLKDPQGFLFSNSILSNIFVELSNIYD